MKKEKEKASKKAKTFRVSDCWQTDFNRPLWMWNEGSPNSGPITRGSERLKHKMSEIWWKQLTIATDLCKIIGPELEDERDRRVMLLGKGDTISRQRKEIERECFCVFSLLFTPRMTLFRVKKIEEVFYRQLENHFKMHFWGQVGSVAGSWYTLWMWLKRNCLWASCDFYFHDGLYFSASLHA